MNNIFSYYHPHITISKVVDYQNKNIKHWGNMHIVLVLRNLGKNQIFVTNLILQTKEETREQNTPHF